MDEQKAREAIEYLSKYISAHDSLPKPFMWKGKEECETAIEALEMQLPKEIKVIDEERSEEFGDVDFYCPNCNSHYLCDIADMPNYCSDCGIRFNT